VGTWQDGINFTAPLNYANSAVVFANKTLRVTTILVSMSNFIHQRVIEKKNTKKTIYNKRQNMQAH